jgi:hypothetical protein
VDDAEDADVIVHEYGHAIQDNQVPGFGAGGDAGSMGEGFGDYLAGTISDVFTDEKIEPECLAEWDGSAFMGGIPPCMRRLDGTKHYPEHLEGEPHADGELWSAVLWEARAAVGAEVMDRLVVEAHFAVSRWEKFPGAAEAIVETDRALYGGRHVDALLLAFMGRGMWRTPMPPALFPDVLSSRTLDVEPTRSGGTYRNNADDTQEVRVPGAAGLRLHFRRIDTEKDTSCVGGVCDNIYVSDGTGYLFQILNGQAADVTSVVVPGEVARVRLVSDRGIAKFGYAIDRVDAMGYHTCGDGVVDGTEACDGADLGGATCQSLGFASGSLACGADCRLNVFACVAADGCGDGEVGVGEECDGAELQGATCASLGLGAGRLACTSACRLDASACSTCGDGIRQPAEACDGADLGEVSCGALGLGAGAVTCSAACTLDVSACVPDAC